MNQTDLVEGFYIALGRAEPWRAKAACRGMGTKEFFPTVGKQTRAAEAICKTCPVQVECGDYAKRSNSTYGVWEGRNRSPNTNSNSTESPE